MSWQALLRSDLPFYMVPFATRDLTFNKPEVRVVTPKQIFLSLFKLLFPDYLSVLLTFDLSILNRL
jgi:hypothetical protein